MTTRPLPPSLGPYLSLPPEFSQILLTSTLGCSINWLTTRFISSYLTQSTELEPVSIVLVSWIRSSTFWKNEIRRTTGIDVMKEMYKDKFAFVDAFSSAYTLGETEKLIERSISELKQQQNQDSNPPKICLIFDTPSLLLATASTTSHSLNTFLLNLRSQVYATVLTTNIDLPLVSAASNPDVKLPPINLETAAFITSQAHASQFVMGVRELETGAAKDVSGVLRVTRGGRWYDDGDGVEEKEFLYLVQRDGNAKVFVRGSEQ